MELTFLQQLAMALGLGLLVGLQREYADSKIAGIRTFPLITVFGVVSAQLAGDYGGWVVAAGLIALAGTVWMGNQARIRQGEGGSGITTEVATLVMFAVGAGLAVGYTVEAIVVGGGVAVLLHWKQPLHGFADRIGAEDIKAIFRLVLIAAVILPVLPNRTYGPYAVLNPFQIWLMVVLIVGISMAAYVAYKSLAASAATLLGGVLGGLISSTAASVGYARQAAGKVTAPGPAAVMIMVASTVVFARVMVEILIVAPAEAGVLLPPMAAMMAVMAVVSFVLYLRTQRTLTGRPDPGQPPSDLRAAIVFGLLYAVIIFFVAAAREHFGDRALYAVAGLSGLTDMDAITLSTAQLVRAERLDPETGWRLVLVGGMANLVFKGIAVVALGGKELAQRVAVAFGVSLLGGAGILALWP